MKNLLYLFVSITLLGCKNQTNSKVDNYQKNNIDIANQFIDAFYSFNEDSLKFSLSYAEV